MSIFAIRHVMTWAERIRLIGPNLLLLLIPEAIPNAMPPDAITDRQHNGYQITITREFLEQMESQVLDILSFQYKNVHARFKSLRRVLGIVIIVLASVGLTLAGLIIAGYHFSERQSPNSSHYYAALFFASVIAIVLSLRIHVRERFRSPTFFRKRIWPFQIRRPLRALAQQTPLDIVYVAENSILQIEAEKVAVSKRVRMSPGMVAVRHRSVCLLFPGRTSFRSRAAIYFQDSTQAQWLADFCQRTGCPLFNADEPEVV